VQGFDLFVLIVEVLVVVFYLHLHCVVVVDCLCVFAGIDETHFAASASFVTAHRQVHHLVEGVDLIVFCPVLHGLDSLVIEGTFVDGDVGHTLDFYLFLIGRGE
jgi:hypothetical protein